MKQRQLVLGLIAATMMVLMGSLPGFCASNVELEERIEKLEQRSADGSALGSVPDWLTFSGTIEIEASFESADNDDSDSDDISLATGEFGIEAKPQDWVTGFMLLNWEDDDDRLSLDEIHITIGASDACPYYLTAGRIYVPFGTFETMMVSDPITQDVVEIRDEAIQVGMETNGFRFAAYMFNGDVQEDDDDTIDVFGASIGYAMETDAFAFDVSVDWINNALEGGGLEDTFSEDGVDDLVAGYAIHAIVGFGPVSVIGEYMGLADDIESNGEVYDEASIYAIEAGYTFDVSGFETTFAIGYQGSDDAGGLDVPEKKFITAVSVGLTENLSVGLEYANAENYSESDGGDGDEFDTVTCQLAFEF